LSHGARPDRTRSSLAGHRVLATALPDEATAKRPVSFSQTIISGLLRAAGDAARNAGVDLILVAVTPSGVHVEERAHHGRP
jgi:hypothetical protein